MNRGLWRGGWRHGLVAAMGLLAAAALGGCPSGGGGTVDPTPLPVEAPAAGAIWAQGSTQTILWDPAATKGATVEILLERLGILVSTIDLAAPNTGEYAWMIPGALAPADNYRVRIRAVEKEFLSGTFTISETSLFFSVSESAHDFGQALAPWMFEAWNGGTPGSRLQFQVLSDADWLNVSPATGSSTGAGNRVPITASVVEQRLPFGRSTANVTLRAPGVADVVLPVSAEKPTPAFGTDAPGVHDFGFTGASLSFDVWNDGEAGSELSVQTFSDQAWLAVTPGAFTSESAQDRTTVSLQVDRTVLAPGVNGATVTLQPEGLPARTVSVTATRPQAVLSTNLSAVDFGVSMTTRAFTVWNSGDPGSTLAFDVTSTMDWLTATPVSGMSTGPNDPVTVELTLDRSELILGPNGATLTLTVGGVPAANIPISARRAVPGVGVSATNFDFGTGGTEWDFDVWNSGEPGSTLQYQVAADAGWVGLTPTSGVSTGSEDTTNVGVTIDRGALAPGVNRATITISSAGVPERSIGLVAIAPQAQLSVSSLGFDFGEFQTEWSFQIWNSGEAGSTLDFNVISNNDWIEASPVSGSSSGPQDVTTIDVSIDRELLPQGQSNGTLTVVSPQSAQPVVITLSAAPPFPAIGLSGTSFDFGRTLTQRNVTLWNDGDPNTTLNFVLASDVEWLSVSPSSGSSTGIDDPQTISMTVDRSTLQTGVNTGVITVNGSGLPPRQVTVTASTNTPLLAVSSTFYDFQFVDIDYDFDVWNADDTGTTLSFTASADKDWVVLTPSAGTSTGPGNRTTIMVTIDRSKLQPGQNSSTVTVNSIAGGTQTVRLDASTPAPAFATSTVGHDFGKTQTMWTFDVWNSGVAGSTLNFDVLAEAEWIATDIDGGASTGPADRVTVTVTVNRATLDDAVHTGEILLTSPNLPTVSISIRVETPQPEITVSAGAHDFAITETQWNFDIWNSGDAGTTLEVLLEPDQQWFTVNPESITSTGPGDMETVTVTINRGAIPTGVSNGTLSLISSNGAVGAIGIGVLFPAARISLSAVSHDFGSSTDMWSFEVWNAGDAGTTLNFQLASDQDWLTLTPTSGTSSGPGDRVTIDADLDRGILTNDTNLGTIFIFEEGTTQQATIGVTATQPKSLLVAPSTGAKADELDGLSWETAYDSLQWAIDEAVRCSIDEVWVAEGVYAGPVFLHGNVTVRGGFNPALPLEDAETYRDAKAYPTVIDSMGGAWCVVGEDDATLEGVTLLRGSAKTGGGVLQLSGTLTLRGCTVDEAGTLEAAPGAAILTE